VNFLFLPSFVVALSFLQWPATGAPVPSSDVDAPAMQKIYDTVKTPFKYGIVVRGSEAEKVDCPNVFRNGPHWWMIYAAFGGRGYETRLATSDDLLQWKTLGPILKPSGSGWDAEQTGGGLALPDYHWNGSWKLQKYEGKYWISYLGGAKPGYETPPLSIGLAATDDPTAQRKWQRAFHQPVLRSDDPDTRWFEHDTLFKSYIIQDASKRTGHPFVMFYNAREATNVWTERIGMAVSDDMKQWKRFGDGPIIDNGPKRGISGDPQVVKIGDLWVMFYFGAFWKPKAFDTFACSRDLVHWTKWEGPHLVEPSEPWDKTFAHKPWIVRHRGVVYHFYCAVGDQGRAIAVATSKDLQPKQVNK
jgi:predicted GH43/DUF377 family glycosyl hydrolase